MNINLNRPTGSTIEEYEARRQKYVIIQREFEMKEIMGMPNTEEERKLKRKIRGLIDQCDMIIDYMIREREDTYEWPGGDD